MASIAVAIGTAAVGARYLLRAWQAFRSRPIVPRERRFYPGGFEPVMTRREAARILGVREHAAVDMIKEAHIKVMKANHPDLGGSHYLSLKISEARDLLLKKTTNPDSAFQ